MIWPLWRTAWGFLNKLRIKLPRNPAVPLVGIYPEETMVEKDTGTPGFIVACPQDRKQPGWPSAETVVHTHKGVLLSRKQ